MYKRLLDKNNEPTLDEVKAYTGSKCYERLLALEEYLTKQEDRFGHLCSIAKDGSIRSIATLLNL